MDRSELQTLLRLKYKSYFTRFSSVSEEDCVTAVFLENNLTIVGDSGFTTEDARIIQFLTIEASIIAINNFIAEINREGEHKLDLGQALSKERESVIPSLIKELDRLSEDRDFMVADGIKSLLDFEISKLNNVDNINMVEDEDIYSIELSRG